MIFCFASSCISVLLLSPRSHWWCNPTGCGIMHHMLLTRVLPPLKWLKTSPSSKYPILYMTNLTCHRFLLTSFFLHSAILAAQNPKFSLKPSKKKHKSFLQTPENPENHCIFMSFSHVDDMVRTCSCALGQSPTF